MMTPIRSPCLNASRPSARLNTPGADKFFARVQQIIARSPSPHTPSIHSFARRASPSHNASHLSPRAAPHAARPPLKSP